jgi:hypothetical protein
VEARCATIAQEEALASAVRLPQSSPDIHTHERRGRLRFGFDKALFRPCRSRAGPAQFAIATHFPSLARGGVDRVEHLNTLAVVAQVCARWDCQLSDTQARSSSTGAVLAPYGLDRNISDWRHSCRSRAQGVDRYSRARRNHMHELAAGS